MGRHTQTAHCYTICNCQLALSDAHLRPPSLIGGGFKPYFHRAQPKVGDRKYKKGEARRGKDDDSFGAGLLPCLGSVCLIKDLSA